jgi:hypothetical protein
MEVDMKRHIILLCFLVLLPVQGFGTFMDGNTLLTLCEATINLKTPDDAVKTYQCSGYISGVVDIYDTFIGQGVMTAKWCRPDTITIGQLARVVTKYLREHPESLHLAAADQVEIAIVLAFPCE